MYESKQWYLSKTVWGALIAVVAGLLQASGFETAGDWQEQLADQFVALSGALGGIVALYGRISAEKRLG